MHYEPALKSYMEAYKQGSQLYEKDPNNQEYKEIQGLILFTIGNLYGSINKHDKAVEYLEKSKSLIGSKYDLLKYLGQEYFFNEQIEESKKCLNEYAISKNIRMDELMDKTKFLSIINILAK